MQLLKFFLLSIILVMLSSCGVVMTKNEDNFMATTPESAWGETPTGYEEPIKNHIRSTLLDPESARFKFGSPFRSSSPIDYMREQNKPVWIIPVFVNAKNSFGGYVGDKKRPYMMQWVNGKLKISPLPIED
jgi:hypothetical protein